MVRPGAPVNSVAMVIQDVISRSRPAQLVPLVLITMLAVACDDPPSADVDVGVGDAGLADIGPRRTPPPVLSGLLFDVRGCQTENCGALGGEGGDVLYGATLSFPLVFGFDFQLPDKPLNPTYEFYVRPDAAVIAPLDATVTRVVLTQSAADYSIWLVAPGSEDYVVIIDHVRAPTVAENDSVVAGQTLGLAGIWNEDQGRTEIQINDDFDDTAVCPVALLDPAIRADYEARLTEMFADFEAVRGDSTLYDETEFVLPGCLYERFLNL